MSFSILVAFGFAGTTFLSEMPGAVRPPLSRAIRRLSTVVQTNQDLTTLVNNAAADAVFELEDGMHNISSTLSISQNIEIRAKNGANPVIHGQEINRVLTITGGNVILAGLGITGGALTGNGGGISVTGGDVSLDKCSIYGNSASTGGGMEISGGTVAATECNINDNDGSFGAGGIYVTNGIVTFTDCNIYDHNVTADGGGMYIGGGDVTLVGCAIYQNSAGPWYGGGMNIGAGDVTLTNCNFYENSAAAAGANVNIAGGNVCSVPPISEGTAGDFTDCSVQPTTVPTTVPTAVPSVNTNSETQVVGDPHNRGGHGGQSDFRGRNNTWYAYLSTQNMSLALLFYLDNYWWRRKKVYGSWMKAIAITTVTKSSILHLLYHVDSPSVVTMAGKELSAGESLEVNGVKVGLTRNYVFSFSNGAWEVEAKMRAIPYKHLNGKKRRLDVSIHPISNIDQDPVAPHGILGQTYDRDDKMVIGALDDYNIPGKVIVTKAMGEGAIEGVAQDYEVEGPFSTSFKFSRFGATGHVPPRNVSGLSGLILPAKHGVAGALNDDVDA